MAEPENRKKPRDIYARFSQTRPASVGQTNLTGEQLIIVEDEDDTSDSEIEEVPSSVTKVVSIPPWRKQTVPYSYSTEKLPGCHSRWKPPTGLSANGRDNESSKMLETEDKKLKGQTDKLGTLVEHDSWFSMEPFATNHSVLNGATTDHSTGPQPLYSPEGLQAVSTAGLQPVSTAGLQPVFSPGDLQAVSTAGLQPVSTAGLHPVSTAGLQPFFSPGDLQAVSTAGLRPFFSPDCLQPVSTAGLQPESTAGLQQPVSTVGLQQPVSTACPWPKSTDDFPLPHGGAGKTSIKSYNSLRATPCRSSDDNKENAVQRPVNGVSTNQQSARQRSTTLSSVTRETPRTRRQPALSARSVTRPGMGNNPHSDSGCYDMHPCVPKLTRNVAVQTTSRGPNQKETTNKENTESQSSSASSLVPKTITVNKKSYLVLNMIGKGGSSKVEQVFDMASSQRLALKTVNLANQPQHQVTAFQKEIEILQKLQFSDRVIKLVDYDYRPEKLLILLECGDTDLAVYLKRKMEEKTLHRMQRCLFWHEMLQAVQVLHTQGIVHSDIKPANFILVAGEVKLIDFGIAKQLDADVTSMVLDSCEGTLNYMSPEVLNGLGTKGDSKAGRKADVWSLGCILYYMTYGVTPFQTITVSMAKVLAITNPLHPIAIEDIGEPHLSHTIQLCLERDYKKRASIEELLRHPYIS